MARILIGNIKGPQGDTGPQGPQGEIGPVGPQGPLHPLINNALATEAGVAALDAVMGKTLQDQITQTNSNLALKANTSDLVKTILIAVDITTQTTAGVALGASAYQQVITTDGVLAGKTVLGACVEGVQNKTVISEVGIGAINTSNGYVYINTLTAGIYTVRVRVYYK